MNRFTLICVLVLLFTVPLFAQVDTAWVRTYSSPDEQSCIAYAIAVDESSNVCVTGEADGYTTIKYRSDGQEQWIRTYVDIWCRAYDVTTDRSGNVYVTGFIEDPGTSFNYGTIKYYPNGDTAWVRRYNGPGNGADSAAAVAVDDSGYVYVTGTSYGGSTSDDYATIKYRSNGDTAWVRRYNTKANGSDGATAIAVDGSGNVFVTGQSHYGSIWFYTTIKYDPSGNQVWEESYGAGGDAYPHAIAVDSHGNVYVTGQSWASGSNYDYATIKYYPNGDTAWVRRYNLGQDAAYALAVDGSGNVYVTGGAGGDYATVKYDSTGTQLWVRSYNGPGNALDEGKAIAIDNLGNIYVTGSSTGSGTDLDYATIKYSPNGAELWIRRHDGLARDMDEAYDIAIDGAGNPCVTGYVSQGLYDIDYATIKYIPSSVKCGDANGDGNVTTSDIVYLVNYLFKGGPPPNPLWKADVNCDHAVNVTDISYLVSYFFQGGHSPACCG